MPVRERPEYAVAFARGLEAVRAQDAGTLGALGAVAAGARRYELPVLDERFVVDLEAGTVGRAGGDVPMVWRILALHYLSCRRPDSPFTRWMSYGDFQDGRVYEKVYAARVLSRLRATVGKDRATFAESCRRLRGERISQGDEGFLFQVFPRLAVAIAWYEGDDEFPPAASFLLPDNALDFLVIEDLAVLSENVVGRLQGAMRPR